MKKIVAIIAHHATTAQACRFLIPIAGGAPEPVTVSWLPEDAPAELRGDATLANFKSPVEIATAYLDAKKKISQKGIIPPPEGTKDDDPRMVEFLTAIGRPTKPEEYEIPTLTLPNGMKMDMEQVKAFQAQAFKAGMTKKAFKEIFGYRINQQIEEYNKSQSEAKTRRDASETRLREAFGAKYEENVQGVQKLLNHYAGENGDNAAVVDLLNSNPDAIILLSKIVGDLSEATIEKIGHARTGSMTPDEARAEIDKIWNDKSHDFHNDKAGKKHLEAKKRMDELYKLAHGSVKK